VIKDIVLPLQPADRRHVAALHALSVSDAFAAHLSAIGFAYEPSLPTLDMGSGIPFDFIEAERDTNNSRPRRTGAY
jgi:hypothetical protein